MGTCVSSKKIDHYLSLLRKFKIPLKVGIGFGKRGNRMFPYIF